MLSSVHQHFEFEPKESCVFIKCSCIKKTIPILNIVNEYLGVGTLLLFALPTSEQVRQRASRGGHLVVSDGFFGQILPHLL